MEPSKQQLLDSIHPEMRLTKSLLKRVYGYGVTDPAFPDKAIAALEAAGCSKARQYYQDWVSQYEAECRAEIEPVAAWYAAECEKQWEKRKRVRKNGIKERKAETRRGRNYIRYWIISK